jgi:hypothetical protein
MVGSVTWVIGTGVMGTGVVGTVAVEGEADEGNIHHVGSVIGTRLEFRIKLTVSEKKSINKGKGSYR